MSENKTVITLKDGKQLLLRSPIASDFDKFQIFMDKISQETFFTNQYPEQPKKEKSKTIGKWCDPNSFFLAVFYGEEIIALTNISIDKPEHPWLKYTASFGISILKEYWGVGLGSRLLDMIEIEARNRRLHRIEGHVRATNVRGIALYIKKGFVIEGCLRDKALINGKWHNQYIIGKIL